MLGRLCGLLIVASDVRAETSVEGPIYVARKNGGGPFSASRT